MKLPKGVIPFSWEEVKKGDRLIKKSGRWVNGNFYETYRENYIIKDGDKTRDTILDGKTGEAQWIYLNTENNQYYIDRRPRYKRLFSSF